MPDKKFYIDPITMFQLMLLTNQDRNKQNTNS